MQNMTEIHKKFIRVFERMPRAPEPRYTCRFCQDSGFVICCRENGKVFPVTVAGSLRLERAGKTLSMAPCSSCDAGLRCGRPSAGSVEAAVQWVQSNVTHVISLSGTYDHAAENGFDKKTVDQAFTRLGIRKYTIAGKWVCEPMPQN